MATIKYLKGLNARLACGWSLFSWVAPGTDFPWGSADMSHPLWAGGTERQVFYGLQDVLCYTHILKPLKYAGGDTGRYYKTWTNQIHKIFVVWRPQLTAPSRNCEYCSNQIESSDPRALYRSAWDVASLQKDAKGRNLSQRDSRHSKRVKWLSNFEKYDLWTRCWPLNHSGMIHIRQWISVGSHTSYTSKLALIFMVFKVKSKVNWTPCLCPLQTSTQIYNNYLCVPLEPWSTEFAGQAWRLLSTSIFEAASEDISQGHPGTVGVIAQEPRKKCFHAVFTNNSNNKLESKSNPNITTRARNTCFERKHPVKSRFDTVEPSTEGMAWHQQV